MNSINKPKRFSRTRRGLLLGSATAAAGLAYVSYRGVRFPRMTFSPAEPASQVQQGSAAYEVRDAIFTRIPPEQSLDSEPELRAIAPEPAVSIQLKQAETRFSISNVSSQAVLQFNGGSSAQISETITGLTRSVHVKHAPNTSLELSWKFDDDRAVEFAIIGDSGGGDELPYCLARAAELGAEFLLHLGDFHYRPGEYEGAIKAFKEASIPSYVTMGNHDFNDKGLVYQRFLDNIGYFNNRFSVAGTEFINIDTAADFFPLRSGQRGRFVDTLEANSKPKIAFSHRPFVDVRPGRHHGMASKAEERWLHETFKTIGCDDYLCGHVHKSGETDVEGLKQWTVGEGLGYEDWVARKPVSQMLMGTVEPETQPLYRWVALDMPWAVHTSPEHLEKLLKEQPSDAVDWYHRTLANSLNSTKPA